MQNVSAAQLVPILRPLIPQYGHLAAYPAVEHADHLRPRLEREPDDAHRRSASTRPATRTIDVIRLEHASATEIVRDRQFAHPAAGAEGGGVPRVKMVADERTNSVLVSGEQVAAAALPRR